MLTPPAQLEAARLKALVSYDIVDSGPEETYDLITRMVTEVCGMPVATITLVDEHRQWFKSVIGLPHRQAPRPHSFCGRAIQTPGHMLEIEDARIDPRFLDNPLTTGEDPVIFYAGVPLVDEDGYALGTLCVIDHKPNQLTDQQRRLLHLLASQVMTLLTLRRSQARLLALNQTLVKANEQYQQTNQLLQAVVDHCPAGLILLEGVRQDGRLVDFAYRLTNPVNARITGLRVEQMLGQTLKGLFPHIGTTNLLQRFVTAIETGQTQRYQQHDHFDQIDMWGEFTLVPLGEQLLVTFQDITPMKLAQDQLRTQAQNLEALVDQRTQELSRLHQRFQLATQAARMGVWSFDSTRNELIWDETLYQLCGLVNTGQPLQLADYERLIHPEDVPAYRPRHKQPQMNQARTNQQRIIRPDGQIRWLELHGISLDNAAGEAIGSVGVVQDITDRKAAEAALLASEQRFRQLAENVDELFWISAESGGEFEYVNPAFERFSGLSLASLRANPDSFQQIIVDADRATLRAAFASPQPYTTLTIRSRDTTGRLGWLNVRLFRVDPERGVPPRRIGVARDVTPIMEKEQWLEESLRQERRVTALQAQFITTASHEFRTPLTVIRSSADLIRFYLHQQAPSPSTHLLAKHLTTIEGQVTALDALIGDTLTMRKLETGNLLTHPEWTDLVGLSRSLIDATFGDRPDGRQVRVSVIGEPVEVWVDRTLLSTVLSNLLGNAFKFSATDPAIRFQFTATGVSLSVIDEGIGIPADELGSIYTQFYRARNAGSYPGTGLGLAISAAYVTLLGGELAVSSQPGVGTRFTLTLPVNPRSGRSSALGAELH